MCLCQVIYFMMNLVPTILSLLEETHHTILGKKFTFSKLDESHYFINVNKLYIKYKEPKYLSVKKI